MRGTTTGAVTQAAEQRAFEQTIDLIMDRLERDPDLHVYHYASYEPTALGRLMGRYDTREVEVDRLLRGDRLVDLYRVVRQGLRASVESYSIKRLEPLYGFEREVELRDAGSSIAAFEALAALGGDGWRQDETPGRIERYNRDDVVSTLAASRLAGGAARGARGELGEQLPRPEVKSGEADEDLAEWLAAGQGGRRTADARVARGRRSRADAGRSTPAGCWPSCSAGTGASRRPTGGATSTSSTT